jgi:hypothetical protein
LFLWSTFSSTLAEAAWTSEKLVVI